MSFVVQYMRQSLFIVLLVLCGCTSTVKAPVITAGQAQEHRLADGRSVGSQEQEYHVVAKGDTLYSIAWRYAYDYREVARWNRIAPPYTIYPGQKIRLRSVPGSDVKKSQVRTSTGKTPVREASGKQVAKAKKSSAQEKISWRWPTRGKIVKLTTPTMKNGANITGKLGQTINAAAAGEVVYSGSGLLGYGKLIIIKHNETYLSAYAHNKDIYIKEGNKVTGGQRVATMGKGNDGMPILHFEIRKNGRPVDPMLHLPYRGS